MQRRHDVRLTADGRVRLESGQVIASPGTNSQRAMSTPDPTMPGWAGNARVQRALSVAAAGFSIVQSSGRRDGHLVKQEGTATPPFARHSSGSTRYAQTPTIDPSA